MENHRPTLDYAPAPKRRRFPFRIALDALFGVVVGMFALLMLIVAIHGIVVLLEDWRHADKLDVQQTVMFAVIGLFCAFMSVRWIWPVVQFVRRRNLQQ